MEDKNLMLLIFLGTLVCFIFVPSTEKGMAGLSAIAAVIGAGSFLLSERAFKQTEKTLKLTEIEQQIRDIEKRLELFYYPVSNYFNINRRTKEGLNDIDHRDLIHAESFRYLADATTREKYETWLEAVTDPKAIDKAEKKDLLTAAIKADIKKYQEKLKELENNKKRF